MSEKFSVLMSLYIKEKPEYVMECFESLVNQTAKATEWVIVEDGPLIPEMYNLLDEYQKKYPGLIKRVPLETNQGLGLALREGVLKCSNELIARMDTDDIAREDRFELQLKEFEKNPNLDICGSHQIEFEDNIKNTISKRNVPLYQNEIYKYQKHRSAFNHVTVMFKKSAVVNSGNYEDCPLMEDDMLWCRMMLNYCNCKNIDDYLVYVRVGEDMYERRGGVSYFRKYKKARKSIYYSGFISYKDYFFTISIQFFVCLLPNIIRKFIFVYMLRKKECAK